MFLRNAPKLESEPRTEVQLPTTKHRGLDPEPARLEPKRTRAKYGIAYAQRPGDVFKNICPPKPQGTKEIDIRKQCGVKRYFLEPNSQWTCWKANHLEHSLRPCRNNRRTHAGPISEKHTEGTLQTWPAPVEKTFRTTIAENPPRSKVNGCRRSLLKEHPSHPPTRPLACPPAEQT